MKIHEYQAKAILARYGVTTPRGEVAFTIGLVEDNLLGTASSAGRPMVSRQNSGRVGVTPISSRRAFHALRW